VEAQALVKSSRAASARDVDNGRMSTSVELADKNFLLYCNEAKKNGFACQGNFTARKVRQCAI
jgi:hypothetical protein